MAVVNHTFHLRHERQHQRCVLFDAAEPQPLIEARHRAGRMTDGSMSVLPSSPVEGKRAQQCAPSPCPSAFTMMTSSSFARAFRRRRDRVADDAEPLPRLHSGLRCKHPTTSGVLEKRSRARQRALAVRRTGRRSRGSVRQERGTRRAPPAHPRALPVPPLAFDMIEVMRANERRSSGRGFVAARARTLRCAVPDTVHEETLAAVRLVLQRTGPTS